MQQDLSAAEKELKKIMQAEERRLSTNQEIETQTYYKTFEVAIQTEFKVPGMTLKQSNAIQDYPTSIGRGSQRLPLVTPAGMSSGTFERPGTSMGLLRSSSASGGVRGGRNQSQQQQAFFQGMG